MAWETGTASNNKDLFNKLKTFLTTNAALVAANQEWTVNRYTADDELMLKGTGLTGTDEIYVNLKIAEIPASDIYNIHVKGAAGYVGANAWNDQPGQSLTCAISLWNDPIKYWFIANGRRFIIVAKVSTFYVAGYFGLFLPYATPEQYPYPLFIGGNLAYYSNAFANSNYSRADGFNSNYWMPLAYGSAQPDDATAGPSFIYWVDGGWEYFANNRGTNVIIPVSTTTRDNIDGGYTLIPHQLLTTIPSKSVAGKLDGSFYVSGFSNGAENIITIGADDYLVVQNVMRNGVGDFAAIALK